MKKKFLFYCKMIISIFLIYSLVLPSYATLSSSDGSAFVTKAEFDALAADFNARLTTFEAGINSKIDSQVTSYLDRNGIWSGKSQDITSDLRWGYRWPYSEFFTPAPSSSTSWDGAIRKSVNGTSYSYSITKESASNFFVLDSKVTPATTKVKICDISKSGLCCLHLYHTHSAYLKASWNQSSTYCGEWYSKIRNTSTHTTYKTLLDVYDINGYSEEGIWSCIQSTSGLAYSYGLTGSVRILDQDDQVKFNVNTFSSTRSPSFGPHVAGNDTDTNTVQWARAYVVPASNPQFIIAQFFVKRGDKLYLQPTLVNTGNCSSIYYGGNYNLFCGSSNVTAGSSVNTGWFNYICQVTQADVY